MIKVKSINFNHLTNDDFIGFHIDVITAALAILFEDVQAQLVAYKAALQHFKDYTTSVSESEAKKKASSSSASRVKAFRTFASYVSLFRKSHNKVTSAMAEEIWAFLKPHKFRGNADQNRLTGIIETVMEDIKKVVNKEEYAAVYNGSELELCVNIVQQFHTEFTEANQLRAKERKLREQENNKRLRQICVGIYQDVINSAQFHEKNGDQNCGTFLNKVNVFVEKNNALYNARVRSHNKNKTEETATEVATAATEAASQKLNDDEDIIIAAN